MNVPTGFGNVRNRCNFYLTHPVSKDKRECIKVGDNRAIMLFENRGKPIRMRVETVVLTNKESVRLN